MASEGDVRSWLTSGVDLMANGCEITGGEEGKEAGYFFAILAAFSSALFWAFAASFAALSALAFSARERALVGRAGVSSMIVFAMDARELREIVLALLDRFLRTRSRRPSGCKGVLGEPDDADGVSESVDSSGEVVFGISRASGADEDSLATLTIVAD